MSVQERQLAIECRQASEALGRLVEILEGEPVGSAVERGPMLGELERCHRRLNRLAAAAMRPPAIGILGPPRSGKSTLARMLATGGGPREPVSILLDASLPYLDLASHLTPSHPASSGIVMRLSAKTPAAPPLFPFPTRLLGLADIVKILARAHLTGPRAATETVVDAASVRHLAVEAGRQLRLFPARGFEAEQAADIREYLEHNFYSDRRVRALAASGYWEQVEALASHLPDDARASLFSPLWGGGTGARAIFLSLAAALETLSHASEAFCPLEAFVAFDQGTRRMGARGDSIAIADTALADGTVDETVMVRTRLGHFAGLKRGDLAALASEVRLCVSGDVGGLIDDLQILEFPALEPRQISAGRKRTASSAAIARAYRRAKREYLHEAAVRDHELSALLVCFDPASDSVDPLAAHVADWVDLAQGREAATREQSPPALFIAALRKQGDTRNALTRAKSDPWLERLGQALADKFGRIHDWPMEWVPKRPFENVFLLRLDADRESEPLTLVDETESVERRLALLEPDADSARGHFLADATVQRHVREPAASWRESQVGSDGGIGYLAEAIASACNGLARQRQIALALRDVKSHLREIMLRNIPVLENSRMLDWRLREAQVVISRQRQATESRRFGFLLEALQVPETEVREVLRHMELTPRQDSADLEAAAAPLSSTVHAAAAIDYWLDRLRTMLLSRECEHGLAMPRRSLIAIVEELCIAARRVDLVGILSARLGWAVSDRMSSDERIDRSALLAASVISGFVSTLRVEDHPGRRGSRLLTDARTSARRAQKTVSSTAAEDHAWRLAFVSLVRENTSSPVTRSDSERSEAVRDLLISLGIGSVWELGS